MSNKQRENIKISIPFSDVLKLNEHQKHRIIVEQSKLIGQIEEWESEALIHLCKAKGGSWINKGTAVLYEYAGYIDEYWNLIDKMSSLKLAILSSITKSKSISLLYEKMSAMCTHFVEMIILYCNWRRLQSTPRQLGSPINIICEISSELIGNNYSGILMSIIKHYPPHLSDVQLVVLCSPVMSYEEFINIVIPKDFQISSNCASLYASIQRFLSLEDRVIPLYTCPRQTLRLPYLPSSLPMWKSLSSESLSMLEEFSNSIGFLCNLEKLLREKVLAGFVSAELFNNNYNGSPTELPKINTLSGSGAEFEESETARKRSVTLSAVMDRSKEADLSLGDLYRRSTVATSSAPPTVSPLPLIAKSAKKSPPHAMSEAQTALLVPITMGRTRLDSETSFEGAQSTSNVSTKHNNNILSNSYNRSQSPYGSQRNSKVTLASSFPPNDSPNSRVNTKSSAVNVMNVIDVLNILSKPMLSRKETLHTVLREIEVNGVSIAELAARKIGVWWRFTIPKIKLLKRILKRNFVREILSDVLDNVIRSAIIRQRRNYRLLRNGAAAKIQTVFRRYNALVLHEKRKIQIKQRIAVAWKFLSVWSRLVLSAVRIFHFIRRFHGKLYASKRRAKQKTISDYKQILRSYIFQVLLTQKLEYQKRRRQSKIIEIQNEGVNSNLFSSNYNIEDVAAICIQKYYRRFIVVIKIQRQKKLRNNVLGHKLVFFLCNCIIRRRLKKKQKQKDNAIKIQKFWRGIKARCMVLKYVEAGLKLKELWMRHRHYKSLKSRLRRVERPYSVTFHSIRNMTQKFLNSNTLKIKISVWWNPLLHIVSENDFTVIIESKKPQFVFVSQPCKVSEDIEMNKLQQDNVAEERINFRRLSHVTSLVRRTTKDELAKQIQTRQNNSGDSSRKSSLAVEETVETPFTAFGIRSNSFVEVVREAIQRKKDILKRQEEEEEGNKYSGISRKESVVPLKPSALLNIDTAIKEEDGSDDDSSSDISSNIGHKEDEVDQTVPLRKDDKQPSPISVSGRLSTSQNEDDKIKDVITVHENNSNNKIEKSSEKEINSNTQLITTSPLPSPQKSRFTERIRNSISMFAFGLRNDSKRDARTSTKLKCDFDQSVKIPGCHGNSVFKFDIIEGERKISSTVFYLSKEGKLMYWGGRYFKELPVLQQKRAVQFNQHILAPAANRQSRLSVKGNLVDIGPILDFEVVAGAPSRSRCQWGRVCVKGSGPFKKAVSGKISVGSFFFGKWDRYYLSLDGDGLHFFENKFSTSSFHSVPLKDFYKVMVDVGRPVSRDKNSKNIVEDLHNVILTTFSGDEIYLRFSDGLSTTQWEEVLVNALDFVINESVKKKTRSSVTDLALPVTKLNSK